MNTLVAHRHLWLALVAAIALQVLVWLPVRHIQAKWMNVPPVPSDEGFVAFSLGDRQFANRAIGIMLQNLGNTGGQYTALMKYDYDKLAQWFYLSYRLDPRSDFTPLLAAYYFGAVESPEKLKPLVDYLELTGNNPEGRKWRWLAHAVYLARFKMNDLDRAYDLATKLASLRSQNPSIPLWTQQMPAFVLLAKGNKQAAYEIITGILETESGKLPPQEILVMRDFICQRLLDAKEAQGHPLCQNIP